MDIYAIYKITHFIATWKNKGLSGGKREIQYIALNLSGYVNSSHSAMVHQMQLGMANKTQQNESPDSWII